MKVIIERFEGEFAIVELDNNKIINVPKELFKNAKEGDVFKIEFDSNETDNRKNKIENIMNNLFIE